MHYYSTELAQLRVRIDSYSNVVTARHRTSLCVPATACQHWSARRSLVGLCIVGTVSLSCIVCLNPRAETNRLDQSGHISKTTGPLGIPDFAGALSSLNEVFDHGCGR